MAVVYGDVMRVVLLFYLAPIWTIVFARWLLDEQLSAAGYTLMGLALAGAAVMLWQPRLGWPAPRTLAEWTGLSAGAMFALSNVLIRKTRQLAIELKALAVFFGGIVAGSACILALPSVDGPGAPIFDNVVLLAVLAVVLLAVNVAVQYGLTHISANRAIVIYLFELVVTAISAWLLAGEVLTAREWIGGIMIVAAGLLSDRLADESGSKVSACASTASEHPGRG
jgi:drug/metabolite transporter (DMT)-like permease